MVINTRGRPVKGKQPQKQAVQPLFNLDVPPYTDDSQGEASQHQKSYDPPRHSSYVPDTQSQGRRSTSVLTSVYHPVLVRNQSMPSQRKGKKAFRPEYVQGDEEKISKFHYSEYIPQLWHDHITKITDVLPDGNCGFRSLAV